MRRFDFFLPLKMTLGTLEVVQTWVQLQRKYRLRPIVEERGGFPSAGCQILKLSAQQLLKGAVLLNLLVGSKQTFIALPLDTCLACKPRLASSLAPDSSRRARDSPWPAPQSPHIFDPLAIRTHSSRFIIQYPYMISLKPLYTRNMLP